MALAKKQFPKPSGKSFPRYKSAPPSGYYRLFSLVGWLVILIFLVIIGVQHYRGYRIREELSKEERQKELYEQRIEELEREIALLEDRDYIEVLARRRLGLVRPGDLVFQLED